MLLNGKRLPINALYDSSGAGAAVDINMIPLSAIERVEILKDGGSAIYGADAVAGVVNFITKRDWTGAEARIGYGRTSRGDGEEQTANAAAGFGSLDKQGYNVLVAVDRFKRDPILRKDRDISSSVDFRRLGGVKDIDVNLRIITATNRNLRDAIEQGRFRLDLFYRLNVIQLTVPSLRERPDDILPLAAHFLLLFSQRFKRDIRGLSPAAESAMLRHDWPGNVRELRNTIERAVVLEESNWVQPENLGINGGLMPRSISAMPPAAPSVRSSTPSLDGMSLEEAEKTMLLNALEKTAWNQTQAAKLLDVTRDTLRYKMKKYDLKKR